MKLARLIFTVMMLFTSTVCFAGADEEEKELNATILTPILEHFPETSSIRKVLSNKIIAQEIIAKKQFSEYEAERISSKLMKNDPQLISMNAKCEAEGSDIDDENDSVYEEVLNQELLSTWHKKSLNCGTYSALVLTIFEFNQRNQAIQRKHVAFKAARIILSLDSTGDHAFVLIEGISGTMFVVDPWIRKVIRLSPKFAHIIPLTYKVVNLNDVQNLEINSFFSKPYYDMIHVIDKTRWTIDNENSANIFDAIHTYNKPMKKLYNTLKPNFPLWSLGYKDMFPQKCSGTLKRPAPECKTNPTMEVD